MLALSLFELAMAASVSTNEDQKTVTVTGTADPSFYWVTAEGEASGVKAKYSQKFTQYFSEIHSPLAGKIGLGHISGDAGHSREYPLTTGVDPSDGYQAASSESASSQPTFGLLRQALDTDSRGYLKTESAPWTSIAAVAGEASTWYGPTISQASQDTQVGTKSTTGIYGGTYTWVMYSLASHEVSTTIPVIPEGSPFKTEVAVIKSDPTEATITGILSTKGYDSGKDESTGSAPSDSTTLASTTEDSTTLSSTTKNTAAPGTTSESTATPTVPGATTSSITDKTTTTPTIPGATAATPTVPGETTATPAVPGVSTSTPTVPAVNAATPNVPGESTVEA